MFFFFDATAATVLEEASVFSNQSLVMFKMIHKGKLDLPSRNVLFRLYMLNNVETIVATKDHRKEHQKRSLIFKKKQKNQLRIQALFHLP